ncbi:hypothetical protein ScPMuIL_012508 [Solemya velum]
MLSAKNLNKNLYATTLVCTQVMPFDRISALHLGLLLLALPAQYLLSRVFSTTETQRSYAIKNLLSSAVGIKNRYFSWRSWQKWCFDILSNLQDKGSIYTGQDDMNGESPAIEVLRYKDPKGYFAGSVEPRSPRPPEVKYRIGQVIKHKTWGYRGVIVGWDLVAKAPEAWFKEMHPKNKERWRQMPNYLILVDTRDRLVPQSTYVPEENIDILSNMQVFHPELEEYFEKFDGAQYLPRPWVKALYPHD